MLESWGCGLYMSAAYTQVFTVISFFNMFYFLFLFRFVLFF